jgi:hypothetical protein
LVNWAQSCKPYIDGIVDAGLIEGDNWQISGIGTITANPAAASRVMEEELIRRALKKTKGNRSQAAKLLEISPYFCCHELPALFKELLFLAFIAYNNKEIESIHPSNTRGLFSLNNLVP